MSRLMTVNGCDYTIEIYPATKTATITDAGGEEIEAVEDITGEYIEFYKDGEFITISPHFGNFSDIYDCIHWFLAGGRGDE